MRQIVYFIAVIFLVAQMSYYAEAGSSGRNYFRSGSEDKITVLKGKVLSGSSPLEFVTVALSDSSGTVIAGATTDSAGVYRIGFPSSAGDSRYLKLLFSLVGYKDKVMVFPDSGISGQGTADIVSIASLDGGVAVISPVSMEEDARMLSEAVVSGKRALVEHQFDRLVLNVSELAVAQTGDALDVLKSSPGVTVDKDGNVKLNGSSVAVWIDGRPSNMSGADLEAFLKGSEGSSIEKVELITNPSAKYDAEGSGGIINIKTRKAFMKGFSGSLRANYGMRFSPRTVYSGDFSANLMYRTDKTNTSFQYNPSYGEYVYGADEWKTYGPENRMQQESSSMSKTAYNSHQIRLGNDWNISPKDVLGVIFTATVTPDNRTYYIAPNIIKDYIASESGSRLPYSELSGQNKSVSKNDYYSLNVNYTRTFDQSKSQELTLNADYWRNGSRSERIFRNEYTFISPEAAAAGVASEGFDDNMRRILDLYSFKADYSQSFWKQTGRVEAGVKAAWSSTRNRYGKYGYDFSAGELDKNARRNDFDYDEQVYAAYVNLAKMFSPKWNAQIGLRGEYTLQDGDWLMTSSDGRKSHKEYFDVFPSAFVSYLPSQKVVLTANYSYRISRPKYWQLNPFREYSSGTLYTQGNMELEPSYNHNVSMTAVLFSRLSLTAGYSRTKNFSDVQTPMVDENGVMGLVFSNAGNYQMGYFSASLSELPLTKWWNLTVSANYGYSEFRAYKSAATDAFGGSFNNSGHSFNAYLATTFFLPKNFKLGADGWVMTPMSMGYFDMKAMGILNMSLIKTIWDGKGTISLYLNDILNTRSTDMLIKNNGKVTYSLSQKMSTRGFRIGFAWRFGTASQQSRRNVGKLDEESRL